MSIGTRIKMRREELGMTQPELACLIGVSKGSIGNYESGISRPNEDILIKLFSALDCDANYLYFDDINKSEDISANAKSIIAIGVRLPDERLKYDGSNSNVERKNGCFHGLLNSVKDYILL